MPSETLICDGCGQAADQEHVARRLQRLEHMTRYRPIHVQALFLGAMSPAVDADHLYSAQGEFRGEGLALLRALGFALAAKSVEVVLTEFQRRGFLFTHILECPSKLDGLPAIQALLELRFPATAARIRRSLKPKKLVLIGDSLDIFAEKLGTELPGLEMVLAAGARSFRLDQLALGSLTTMLNGAVASSL